MDRKSEIIGLTCELLMTKGYDSLSYQDLSDALGITKASIHHHFPRKADLGIAACRYLHDRLIERFDLIRIQKTNAWEQLSAVVAFYDKLVGEERCNCPISSLQAGLNLVPEEIRAQVRKTAQVEVDFFVEILEKGRASGEFDFSGSSDSMALLFVSAFKGGIQISLSHGVEFYRSMKKQLMNNLVSSPKERVGA
ncbi:MAG: TetR/AcrR family transcriptional repressor of nem operon [Candidatus Latescibacterota bacterium]|jgi:TetR/AcrR family transcriptional repressor of nem operon